jgi:hypothetical protein
VVKIIRISEKVTEQTREDEVQMELQSLNFVESTVQLARNNGGDQRCNFGSFLTSIVAKCSVVLLEFSELIELLEFFRMSFLLIDEVLFLSLILLTFSFQH